MISSLPANFLEGKGSNEKERQASLVYNSIYLELLGTHARLGSSNSAPTTSSEDELIRKIEGQLDIEQEKLLRENGHDQ